MMRIVQVGIGFWGRGWMEILADSGDVDLVGVIDNDAAARQWAEGSGHLEPRIVFASLAECLANVNSVDAVLVTVPPQYHAEVVFEALEYGLHCLVEKPLAPSLEEGRRMVAQAAARGRTIMVAQNYRFKSAANTVRWLIGERGAIGEVERASVRFGAAPEFSGFRLTMDEPLVVDMAIHHFDLMRSVLGVEAAAVRAWCFNPSWSPFAGNACAQVDFRCTSGAVIGYQGSWCERGPVTSWDGDWKIEGTRGCVTWIANRVTFYPERIDDSVYFEGATQRNGSCLDVAIRGLDYEERRGTLHEFADSVAAGRSPICNGADNLKTLAMVFGAVDSNSSAATVEL